MSKPELKQATNGKWYVHWTENRRSKRVSTSTSSLAEAKEFLGNWLLMEQKETRGQVLTHAELWALYDAQHLRSKKIVDPSRQLASWKNLQPHFGSLTPGDVTQDVIDAYVEAREDGDIGRASGHATIWLELHTLFAVWNFVVRRRVIASTALPVVDEFDLPDRPGVRDRWLRQDEIAVLRDAAAASREGERLSRLERFVWLGLETAARKTAILQLRWDAVDLETRVIDYTKGAKKTRKRRAVVPISDALMPVLRRAYDERISPYVLDTADHSVVRQLASVSAKAGLEGVTPHVLRHTMATHMARNGVSLWKIAGILGNTVAMVEKVYAKHAPDGLVDAVNAFDGGKLRAVR